MKTYENALLGIKFQYPPEWKIGYEQANGIGFQLPTNQSSVPDLVYVVLEDTKGSTDLKQYLRNRISKPSAPLNFSSLKLTETNLSGLPAMNTTFIFNDGRNAQMVHTIKNETAYSIMYIAEPNTYSNHLADVNNIIKSFEIIP